VREGEKATEGTGREACHILINTHALEKKRGEGREGKRTGKRGEQGRLVEGRGRRREKGKPP